MMHSVKHIFSNFSILRMWFIKRPFAMLVLSVVMTTVVIILIDTLRAWAYQREADRYVVSARVQSLSDAVDKLQRSSEKSSYFCAVNLSNLSDEFTASNSADIRSQSKTEADFQLFRERLEDALPAPSIRTVVAVLPVQAESLRKSNAFKESTSTLRTLSQQDVRSEYCTQLASYLFDLSALQKLAQPEAVVALQVGQLDALRTKLSTSLTRLASTRVPSVFRDHHTAIIRNLERQQKNLTRNENDYVAFSRRIELDVRSLQASLNRIRSASKDLQNIPVLIALQFAEIEAISR